jgi:hypothetical protein
MRPVYWKGEIKTLLFYWLEIFLHYQIFKKKWLQRRLVGKMGKRRNELYMCGEEKEIYLVNGSND